MKIILVDDDEVIRKGIKKIIENVGFDYQIVGEAGDGACALEVIKSREDIDLLITDVRMPVMDGIELIKHVRKFNKHMKIIVLSGLDDFRYVREAFKDGAADYLLKPIKKKEFIELLLRIDEDIIEEEKSSKRIEKGSQLMIADSLNRLFHNQEVEENRFKEDTGIDFGNSFIIGIVELDRLYKEKVIKSEVKNKMEEIILDISNWFSGIGKVINYTDKQRVILVIFSEEKLDGRFFDEKFYELDQCLGEKTSISIGISNTHTGFKKVCVAYGEAVEAIETRFYMGKNHCICYADIKKKSLDFEYDPEMAARNLAKAIEIFDYVGARNVMEKVFMDLSFLRPIKFRKYIQDIIELLSLQVKDFDKALVSSENDYKFYISDINTYNELRAYTMSLIKEVILFLENEKKKKSLRRIELAKQFINENYMKLIALNDVAEYVELNASYLSNLFKTETGANFSEYLLDVRMNKAMELLKDPKIKVYEIGNMVGYEDAVSFGRAFKKKIRMSPKEYRNTVY